MIQKLSGRWSMDGQVKGLAFLGKGCDPVRRIAEMTCQKRDSRRGGRSQTLVEARSGTLDLGYVANTNSRDAIFGSVAFLAILD